VILFMCEIRIVILLFGGKITWIGLYN
jgi:hypothetical protein